MDKLIHDSQNVCECLILNEMHIKLASLIICATNDNLTNTSSTLPPKVRKKTKHCTVYTTYNFVHLNRNFCLLES